jgi:hypothetical protein
MLSLGLSLGHAQNYSRKDAKLAKADFTGSKSQISLASFLGRRGQPQYPQRSFACWCFDSTFKEGGDLCRLFPGKKKETELVWTMNKFIRETKKP